MRYEKCELKCMLQDLDIEINQVIPEGGSIQDLRNLPKTWFNLVPYREVGLMTAFLLLLVLQNVLANCDQYLIYK